MLKNYLPKRVISAVRNGQQQNTKNHKYETVIKISSKRTSQSTAQKYLSHLSTKTAQN